MNYKRKTRDRHTIHILFLSLSWSTLSMLNAKSERRKRTTIPVLMLSFFIFSAFRCISSDVSANYSTKAALFLLFPVPFHSVRQVLVIVCMFIPKAVWTLTCARQCTMLSILYRKYSTKRTEKREREKTIRNILHQSGSVGRSVWSECSYEQIE